jgi:hypothetical protein
MPLPFWSLTTPPVIRPGDVLGFVMQHKTGPDRGFAWTEHDPKFSSDWKRIPVQMAVPAPAPLAAEALAKLIADTAEEQGIEPEAVEAFSSLLTAVARRAEQHLLDQMIDSTSNDVPATDTVDSSTFGGLLAELLDAAENSIKTGNSTIYKAARDRFVYHIDCWGRACAQDPDAVDKPATEPAASALIRSGLPRNEAMALAAALRAQGITNSQLQIADAALDALEDGLERVYAACAKQAPTEVVGDLIRKLMDSPDWALVRSALATES